MKPSTRSGKRILAVDDDTDLLEVLEEEILAVYPDFKVEKTHRFWQAVEKITCITYDAVSLHLSKRDCFK